MKNSPMDAVGNIAQNAAGRKFSKYTKAHSLVLSMKRRSSEINNIMEITNKYSRFEASHLPQLERAVNMLNEKYGEFKELLELKESE